MSRYFTRFLFVSFIMLMLNIEFAASMNPGSLGSDGMQLHINNLVGDVIDAGEAKYYGLFSDIEGFECATFYDYASASSLPRDPSSRPINVKIMRTMCTGVDDTGDSAWILIEKNARIDLEVFQTIGSYITFFKDIISNDTLLRLFVKNHKIGWPLVSAAEVAEADARFRINRHMQGLHFMGCLGSSAAYTGSIIGTEVTRSYECVSYYRIDPKWVLGMAAAGAGAGYGLNYLLYPDNTDAEAIRHGIVLFDGDMPITERDIAIFGDDGFDWVYAGCMTMGLLSSVVTGMALLLPWGLMSPETNMDCLLTVMPVVAVSGAEFNAILKISGDYAEKRHRQAAIEKIKKKREEERLKRLNNSE